MGKLKIDLSTKESRNEICKQLMKFKYKSEAYRYLGVPDNKYGIEYLKTIAKNVDFNLDYYKEKRENEKIKNCLFCGKKLEKGQKKFCCLSCSSKYNNIGKKRSEETKQKISESVHNYYEEIKFGSTKKSSKNKYICKTCGKEFETYEKNRVFCCGECRTKYDNIIKTKEWLEGKEYNSEKTPEFIRRYLYKKYDGKCQICGWCEENQHTHKVPLQVHHIDGDCTNNKEENLQLLCPNCHSLTETFGSRNKNNSKRYKLKEYKHSLSKVRLLSMLKGIKEEERKEILEMLK